MPTARMMKEGSMKIGASFSYPYEYTFITATPFSWLEASYKYTELENQLYQEFHFLLFAHMNKSRTYFYFY